ncbi:MAG: hypothetical protein NTY07_11160 [Bacteroidia bacterium]|nr:hypothetical protein [Bacteroidia bacterium]
MKICPITELQTKELLGFGGEVRYSITSFGKQSIIALEDSFDEFSKTDQFIENRYLIAGAILNHQLRNGESDGIAYYSIGIEWEEKLSRIIYPKTPKDKMDNLLKTLYQMQRYDGEEINLMGYAASFAFLSQHFFKNSSEYHFYFRLLQSENLIDPTKTFSSRFTLKGLNYYSIITESGRLSNKCFVAMAFSDETKEIREAIREALKVTGFDPIIIDEQHIDSHKTINDAIIAELKGAKFCIADFTMQREGVYFESGFALGQGKPVIYCCRNDHFKKSHFDTKHFAHILYDTPSELKESLINKINAWIK